MNGSAEKNGNAGVNELVHAWPVREGQDIQVRLAEYRGKLRLDVRMFTNERPTPRGIGLPIKDLGQLRTGLDAAERKLREMETGAKKAA